MTKVLKLAPDNKNAFIKDLVNQKFNLFNVDMTKCPINKAGSKMKDWINKSFTELVSHHNYNSNLWGMKLGQQENGRFIMSLDFDVFDKNAENGVCKITKELLETYISNCGNQNGMYSSSTEGNMNVLVDYSSCDDIKEYVKKLGTAKFQKEGLEVLLAGNQVIPPSQTNCKKTKQLGKPRTFIVQEQPFYIIEDECDFTYLFIKVLFEEKLKSLEKSNKKLKNTLVKKEEENTDTEGTSTEDDDIEVSTDKWIDLLYNVIKNEKNKKGKKIIDWDVWFQIAGILKYNKYDRSVFTKYSQFLDEGNEAGKLWDSIRNPNKTMSIYGLQNIAKKVNHQGYKDWLVKHNEFLHLGILEKGENDIARFIAPYLIISLVYCRNEWWEYNSKTCLWSCIKEPSATITTLIQRKIDESLECLLSLMSKCEDEDEYKELASKKKVYTGHYSNACKSGFNNMIVKYLKSYLCDNDFYDKLDDGLYKMVYKNGILDLKTMIFKTGISQSDYITKTIPFDYEKPKEEDLKYVRLNLKKICNWNEKHLEYYLSSLGYAFTGDSAKEQKFWYLRGQTAENGKSIVFEVLELLMPNYVIKGGSNILDKGVDLKKEVATWRGIKLLWLNEVSVKAKDEDLVKALCDGTGYKYNRNYAIEAVVMPIRFKLFAVSNNTLTIKGDAGVKRRFKLEQFNSQFKEVEEDDYENLQFIKDIDFKDKLCDQYKNALIYLILTYSNKYWKEKKLKEYPSEWNEEAEDVMKDNNEFSEWFKDTFEIKEGAMIHKTDFETILNASKYKNLKIKDELARMKISYKYESQKEVSEKGKGKRKGFWVGFKEQEPEPETETTLLLDIADIEDEDLEV
jgi:hypothetical protein